MIALAYVFLCFGNGSPAPALTSVEPRVETEDSLQDLLERSRKERDRILDGLRTSVGAAVARIDELASSSSQREWRKARTELRAAGSVSTPLLVPYLETGEEDTPKSRRRTKEVSNALRDLGVHAVSGALIQLGKKGTQPARVHALTLLGFAPPDDEIDTFLDELATSAPLVLRRAALAACVRRGTPQTDAHIDAALNDGDKEALLTIFTELRADDPERLEATLIRAFTLGRNIQDWIKPALARLDEVEQPLSDELIGQLGKLLDDTSQSTRMRSEILASLVPLKPCTNKAHKRRLSNLAKSGEDDLRIPALKCLAIAGDKPAKRQLLQSHDELIANERNYWEGYTMRAALLLELRDYSAAARDLKTAVGLQEKNDASSLRETRLDLARAYAGAGKLRNAHDALRDAGLSSTALRLLAEEPIFADLVANSRYGKLFR